MRSKVLATVLIITLAVSFSSPLPVEAAPVGFPILLDLSHKQPTLGIETILEMVPEAEWYILVDSADTAKALPAYVTTTARVLIGSFDTIDLEKLGIVMVIFGQPQTTLKPEEIAALAKWFKAAPGRAIWVSADSDYPAQGSERSQVVANTLLEALGSRLRMDYTSAYDHFSNAGGATYRVLAYVNLSEVPELRYGCDRVLFHGPGPIAWVDDRGAWRKLTPNEKPPNTFILAVTSPQSEITENQAEPTGVTAKVYKPGDRGSFTLMAAELVPVKNKTNVVILSGETPYGGYQPMATWGYYREVISGPRFVRNVILWATGYMGELKEYANLAALPEQLRTSVNRALDQARNELNARLTEVSNQLSTLRSELDKTSSTVNAVSSTANTAMILAVVALLLAVVGLALSFRKKP